MAARGDQKSGDLIAQARSRFVGGTKLALVLTDPNQADNPIIYVNRAFERMTGYSREAAIGRNCRFLQGDDQNQPAIGELRDAVQTRQAASVELRNYRADGTAFLNRLLIAPIENEHGDLIAYAGIQSAIGDTDFHSVRAAEDRDTIDHLELRLRETHQRVRAHLSLIATLIRGGEEATASTGGGQAPDAADILPIGSDLLSHRIEALSLLYEDFAGHFDDDGSVRDLVSAGEYVTKIVATLMALDARQNIRINLQTDVCMMSLDRAAPLGLIVSELISSLLAISVDREDHALVQLSLRDVGANDVKLSVETLDVRGLGQTFGLGDVDMRIVRGLARNLGAKMSIGANDEMVRAQFDMTFAASRPDA